MLLVDSSGWMEFFAVGPLSDKYRVYLKNLSVIITPTIVICEVYKKIKRERTEDDALAADMSLKHSMPMADAMVYATAVEHGCKLVTGDAQFKG